MNLQSFCDMMERIAPKAYAMEGDRIGLLIGTERKEIRRVLVALDLTAPVAREAIDGDFDLVLTHHPIFWEPVTSMDPYRYETAAAFQLIRHNIGMFAAHTNLDAAPGGVNDSLAALLGLVRVRPLPPENLGRIGELPKPMRFSKFVVLCESRLHAAAHTVGNHNDTVQTIGMIGGAGGGEIAIAKAANCDVFVTGEMKHHEALEAEYLGMHCCVLGHYETENIVLAPLINRLQKEKSDVQYKLTQSGKAPMPCPQGGNRYE